MRIRIKFTKNECIKYLGHLDILRAFQKCMNRAGIRMIYSEGFNPHQKMSFALPLGVGMMSTAEYLDAQVADGQDPEEIKMALQNASGPGFDILNVKILKEGAVKAMAAVRYADFEAAYEDTEISEDQIEHFLERKNIKCLKKTKSGEKEEDIRPMIISLSSEKGLIRMRLCAGSEHNLKADNLLEKLFEDAGIIYDRYACVITRKELMGEDFVPLDSLGTE